MFTHALDTVCAVNVTELEGSLIKLISMTPQTLTYNTGLNALRASCCEEFLLSLPNQRVNAFSSVCMSVSKII